MHEVVRPPRFVAGIIVREHPDDGVMALLLRQWFVGDPADGVLIRSDLPGGLLLPSEFPLTGIKRLLLESHPIDAHYAAELQWSWMQNCTVVPRGDGAVGAGFVLALRVPDHKAGGLVSKDSNPLDGVLRWCDLADVRRWMTFCPDGVLAFLIKLLTARGTLGGVPIHQDLLWPDCGAAAAPVSIAV